MPSLFAAAFLFALADDSCNNAYITHFARNREMRIEHIALYVTALEAMRDFYIKYFGAISNAGYHNPQTGLKSYFLSFSDGARLELMSRPEITDCDKPLFKSGFIHLAFSAGSSEKVDELTAQLKADGFEVISGPRTTGDGYYESCILDPEGNQIEITV